MSKGKKHRKGQYSNRFNEDYAFYLANRKKFTFCGQLIPDFVYNKDGIDAKEAFFQLDTYGKTQECSEPELLREILRCKKAVNWQIKEWVEGFYDMCEPFSYYIKSFINPPSWVLDSLKRAVWKRWDVAMTKEEKKAHIDFWHKGASGRR